MAGQSLSECKQHVKLWNRVGDTTCTGLALRSGFYGTTLSPFNLINPLLPTWLQRHRTRDSTTPETCQIFDRTLLLNGAGSWPCLLLSFRTWLAYVTRLEGWKYLFPSDPILQGTLVVAINIVYVVGVLKWLRNEARQRAARPSDGESMQQEIGTGLDELVKSETQQRFAESAVFA